MTCAYIVRKQSWFWAPPADFWMMLWTLRCSRRCRGAGPFSCLCCRICFQLALFGADEQGPVFCKSLTGLIGRVSLVHCVLINLWEMSDTEEFEEGKVKSSWEQNYSSYCWKCSVYQPLPSWSKGLVLSQDNGAFILRGLSEGGGLIRDPDTLIPHALQIVLNQWACLGSAGGWDWQTSQYNWLAGACTPKFWLILHPVKSVVEAWDEKLFDKSTKKFRKVEMSVIEMFQSKFMLSSCSKCHFGNLLKNQPLYLYSSSTK